MAISYKKLGQATLTGGGVQDVLYTVPVATETIVKQMTVVNFSGAIATIEIWQGGLVDANMIQPSVSFPAGGFATFDGVITMEAGETIVAEASAAASFTVTVYGAEIT